MQPFVVLSNPGEWCVTFAWPESPDVYVGYRFVEGEAAAGPTGDYRHQPRLTQFPHPVLPSLTSSAVRQRRSSWVDSFKGVADDGGNEAELLFQVDETGIARVDIASQRAAVHRRFSFQPAADGVWLALEVTATEDIHGSYSLQQCLRFTGAMNGAWRREIAHTPFLSELDMQAMGNANGTLTYARQDNAWRKFPVQQTRLQARISAESAANETDHGDTVDHGLIVRESPDRKEAPTEYFERVAPGARWDRIAAGFYWERTTAISNRHPADCLHAWVDAGPLEAGESRTLHGKFYYLEGDKDGLLSHWRKDFGRTADH